MRGESQYVTRTQRFPTTFGVLPFGIFLLLLKGNRAAGTHCLLTAAPAGYKGAECEHVSACCYRHYGIWGITTPGQGINRHWASELSSRLECSHWWPCLPWLGIQWLSQGGVTVQVVNCAVLPRGHPIGMLLLVCLHTTAVPQF